VNHYNIGTIPKDPNFGSDFPRRFSIPRVVGVGGGRDYRTAEFLPSTNDGQVELAEMAG